MPSPKACATSKRAGSRPIARSWRNSSAGDVSGNDVVWRSVARRDFDAIWTGIEEKSPARASKIGRLILAAAAKLETMPRLGRPGRVEGTREWLIARSPYLIVYALRGCGASQHRSRAAWRHALAIGRSLTAGCWPPFLIGDFIPAGKVDHGPKIDRCHTRRGRSSARAAFLREGTRLGRCRWPVTRMSYSSRPTAWSSRSGAVPIWPRMRACRRRRAVSAESPWRTTRVSAGGRSVSAKAGHAGARILKPGQTLSGAATPATSPIRTATPGKSPGILLADRCGR